MIYLYIFINIIYILFSFQFFGFIINPISVYSFIWVIVTTLYNAKLIYYYDLTMFTWLIIIIFQSVYIIGCILGSGLIKKNNRNFKISYTDEKKLRVTIIILTLIASISFLESIYSAINYVGFLGLFSSSSLLYRATKSGEITGGTAYLGEFIYIALIFSAIYIKKYTFRWFLYIPIIILALGSLISGGRTAFIIAPFLMIFTMLLWSKKKREKNMFDSQKNKKFFLIIGILIFVILFFSVTFNRSQGLTPNQYTSDFMIKLMNISPASYKIYHYLVSPIGVLNEFLKNPEFDFGRGTFRPLISILNKKLGFNIKFDNRQKFYYFPVSSNVGTYIRGLLKDFKILLSLVITLLYGGIFSYNYIKSKVTKRYINILWSSTLAYVAFMSFFVWWFRRNEIWVILIFGSIFSIILDQKIKIKK